MLSLRRIATDENGSTSVEYAVMLALILAAIMTAVVSFGGQAGTLWGQTNQNLQEAGLGRQ